MDGPETLYFSKKIRLRPHIPILHNAGIHIFFLSNTNWSLEMSPISCQGLPVHSLGHQTRLWVSKNSRGPEGPGWPEDEMISFRASSDLKTSIREIIVLTFLTANGKLKAKNFLNGLKLPGKMCNSQGTWFFVSETFKTHLPYQPTWKAMERNYVWQGELCGGGNDNPPVRQGKYTGSSSWQDWGR